MYLLFIMYEKIIEHYEVFLNVCNKIFTFTFIYILLVLLFVIFNKKYKLVIDLFKCLFTIEVSKQLKKVTYLLNIF